MLNEGQFGLWWGLALGALLYYCSTGRKTAAFVFFGAGGCSVLGLFGLGGSEPAAVFLCYLAGMISARRAWRSLQKEKKKK